MRTDVLIMLRVHNSLYELNSRGEQSKYLLHNNVCLQKDAHGFTDNFACAEQRGKQPQCFLHNNVCLQKDAHGFTDNFACLE